MGAVTIAEALAIESAALANGWTEEQLLNSAGEALGHAIARHFPEPGTLVGYLGKGHNAGDALVALRILRDQHGWQVATRNAYPLQSLAPLTLNKWDELGLTLPLDRAPQWRNLKRPLILLDGLVGSGASGPLREPLADLANEMNSLRQRCGARIAAVDFPSGIDPDSGQISSNSINADVTFMIGNAKLGLLKSHAANATGALALVYVPPLTAPNVGELNLIAPAVMESGKSPRPFDFHKGTAGRVAILAGSKHFTGAAVMAASGALRGGAGLVTLFVPASIHQTVAAKCPPEVIIRSYEAIREVSELRFDSLVVGCGLGELDSTSAQDFLTLISQVAVPVVIDADALNLIAAAGRSDLFRENHVLTPHPGEFARLAPDLADLPREAAARQFADRTAATLLLKGCRTIVTRCDQALWCNSTGSPAMASGGQGDVLAGVIGARLAIHETPMDAARMGAWLCGRSAEIALNKSRLSEESLLPCDVLDFLGAAFRDWKTSLR
jgi:hydroxyethylthiazole kinase-like uncharacterized protein yjeF